MNKIKDIYQRNENYKTFVGNKVYKRSKKPFKSGGIFNTVKDIKEHPILKIVAFVFDEDNSYVECRRCFLK